MRILKSFFCLFLFPLTAVAQQPADADKVLTIVVHHFPPYTQCEGKTVQPSFIRSVVNKACAVAAIDCELTCRPNRRSKLMLESGEAHGNYPMGWNADRDDWLYWSPALHSDEYGFFQNAKSDIKQLSDLRDKTVGVFGPSNLQAWLERLQKQLLQETGETFEIYLQPNFTGSNMRKLSLGRIDAVFVNRSGGEQTLLNEKVSNVNFAFGVKKLNYYVAFSREKNTGARKLLMRRFNEGVEKLHNDGTIAEIIKTNGMKESLPGIR